MTGLPLDRVSITRQGSRAQCGGNSSPVWLEQARGSRRAFVPKIALCSVAEVLRGQLAPQVIPWQGISLTPVFPDQPPLPATGRGVNASIRDFRIRSDQSNTRRRCAIEGNMAEITESNCAQ